MSISSSSAKELVRLGSNIEITDNANYASSTVKELVRLAATKGGTVTVHASSYSSSSLKEFVQLGGNAVKILI